MGLAATRRLAAQGREVIVFERFRPGHDRGSSHGPTRVFRLVYADPFYARLGLRAIPAWRDLESDAGRTLLDLTGGVDIGPPESLEPIERALSAAGASRERVPRVGERFPSLRSNEPALFSPDTGVIDAAGTVEALLELATANGATLRSGREAVIESAEEDRAVVRAGEERVRVRCCVVAAGAWAGPLLGTAGISFPLEVTQEQILYFDQHDEFPVVAMRRDAPRFRFALPRRFGSPGARAGWHRTGPAVSASDRVERDPTVDAGIRSFAADTLPVDPEPSAGETCLYTTTPDEDFVIDRAGALVIVSPCSGHGFKFAPLIGDAAAALATGHETGIDLARFSVARFR